MISGAHCRISLHRDESDVLRAGGCGGITVELRDTSRSDELFVRIETGMKSRPPVFDT